MANNKFCCLCAAMLFFTAMSFGQGNYLGYQRNCLDIVGEQVINCLKEVIGEQRYAELLKIRQQERKFGDLKIGIDSVGKAATYTIYDEHSLLTEEEKCEFVKKIDATYFDICTNDWWEIYYHVDGDESSIKERTKEEFFKLQINYNGTIVFLIPFPDIPLDER